MSSPGDVPSRIHLDPATAVLKADLVVGLERALFGPTANAVTIQSGGFREQSGWFTHPSPYYLARMAFLHLDNVSADGKNRPFKLAAGIQSHLLDVEKAALMPDEELQALGYTRQDGIRLTLLDIVPQIIQSSFILFRPTSDEEGEFKVRSIAGRYIDGPLVDDGLAEIAYRLSSEVEPDAAQSTDMTNPLSLQGLRVIDEILKNGQPDQTVIDNLAESSTLGLVDEGLKGTRRSQQYLYAMFKKAVETTALSEYLLTRQQ